MILALQAGLHLSPITGREQFRCRNRKNGMEAREASAELTKHSEKTRLGVSV